MESTDFIVHIGNGETVSISGVALSEVHESGNSPVLVLNDNDGGVIAIFKDWSFLERVT